MNAQQFKRLRGRHGFYSAYKFAQSKIKSHNYNDNFRAWVNDDVIVKYDHEAAQTIPDGIEQSCIVANSAIKRMIRQDLTHQD